MTDEIKQTNFITPDPSNARTTMLDLLEQSRVMSMQMENAHTMRSTILQKLDKVLEATAQIPNLLYRIEQLEKAKREFDDQIRVNTEHRIRMETGQNSRRAFLGVVGGAVGATLVALMNFLINRSFGR